MTSKIKIIQHNLNGQRIASLQLREHCAQNKVNIALLQEPVAQSGKIYGFEDCRIVGVEKPGAVIAVMDSNLQVMVQPNHTSTNIATIKLGHGPQTLIIVSAYFKYNIHTHAFTEILRAVFDEGIETVIGADINGHSPRWYCRDRNQRGQIVEDLIDDYNLRILNSPGQMDTYARLGMGSSSIDVTISTPGVASKITGWLVTDVTDSDHRSLSYTLEQNSTIIPKINKRFDIRRADWDSFVRELSNSSIQTILTTAGIDTHATSLMNAIITAAKKCIPIVTKRRWAIKKQPWWTDKL